LTTSFGLDQDVEKQLRDIGPIFDPSVVVRSRALFADRMDSSLPPGGRLVPDIAFGDHERQKLDLCVAPGSGNPVALFVPGGGMVGGDKSFYSHIPAFWARKGYLGVAMNYRLAPEFLYPSGAQDVARAIDWLAQNVLNYGGDPNKIFIVAQSAGAVHTACTVFDKRFYPSHYEALRAVVLMSGVYKVTPNHEGSNINLYFGNNPEELEDRSSCNKVSAGSVPTILCVAQLEPAFFGISAAAMMDALTRRDRRAPECVWLRGHNHLSPVLNMGGPGDTLGDAIDEAFRAFLRNR
jgi:acetyl esterase/lipase